MNKKTEASLTTDQTSVSRLAYQLWESAGCPAGRDLEFWLAAEVALRASAVQNAPVSAKANDSRQKPAKASPSTRGGLKKSWPKPYPSLPKF